MFAILALAFISIFSCGSYILHLSYLHSYKKEFKSFIKSDRVNTAKQTITIAAKQLYVNSSNIIWKDEYQEMIINGVLYDVLDIKINHSSALITLVSDKQELELKKQFASLYDFSKNKKEPCPVLKSFFSLKSVLNSSDFEFKNYVSHLTETYLDSIYKTVTLYYSQETPPPNFIS